MDETKEEAVKEGEEVPKLEEKPLSIVEEAKKAADENKQILKELREERIKLAELKATEALGGTTEGRVDPKVEEVSAEQYSKDALAGKVGDPVK